MAKALLIGGSIVGGIFVGFVAYKVVKNQSSKLLGPLAAAGQRVSGIIADARQEFSDGFADAYYGLPQRKTAVIA
ncbi:MAG: hypothetical protein ACYS1A_10995 [Planctomycetota bacterium]|jgi:hypothetical protein